MAGEKVSRGYGINDPGQAAGVSSNPNGDIATLLSNGKAINLGALEPLDVAIATALQIVGIAIFLVTNYHRFKAGKHVGFIARNGTLVDLNTLVPSNSGFTITHAFGINDSGEILCDATNTSGYAHTVLLLPK